MLTGRASRGDSRVCRFPQMNPRWNERGMVGGQAGQEVIRAQPEPSEELQQRRPGRGQLESGDSYQKA